MRHAFPIMAAAAVLALLPTLAHAQAVGGAYRGNLPGYYYSLGGYSGGRYFNPGYYPNPAPRTAAPAAVRSAPSYYYGSTISRRPAARVGHQDYTTGRDNVAVPLAKPWLRPLR